MEGKQTLNSQNVKARLEYSLLIERCSTSPTLGTRRTWLSTVNKSSHIQTAAAETLCILQSMNDDTNRVSCQPVRYTGSLPIHRNNLPHVFKAGVTGNHIVEWHLVILSNALKCREGKATYSPETTFKQTGKQQPADTSVT